MRYSSSDRVSSPGENASSPSLHAPNHDDVSPHPLMQLSSFRLSYYTLLNLLRRMEGSGQNLEYVIRQSFSQFQYDRSLTKQQEELGVLQRELAATEELWKEKVWCSLMRRTAPRELTRGTCSSRVHSLSVTDAGGLSATRSRRGTSEETTTKEDNPSPETGPNKAPTPHGAPITQPNAPVRKAGET